MSAELILTELMAGTLAIGAAFLGVWSLKDAILLFKDRAFILAILGFFASAVFFLFYAVVIATFITHLW